MRGRTPKIRRFILDRLFAYHPENPSQAIQDTFGISPQAAARHLRLMVKDGLIEPTGNRRGRAYLLRILESREEVLPLDPDSAEHDLWAAWMAPCMGELAPNVRDICHYGFTEIVNNVIDHSESADILLSFARTATTVHMMVADSGVGVFNKIQRHLGFSNKRDAIFELTKGKLTTDPERHTGEGIFFSSRMFDRFTLGSEDLALVHRDGGRDWLIESQENPLKGTVVSMVISPTSTRETQKVFDHYAMPQEDYGFARTNVIVDLARSGAEERLVSRSQARRILARFERFREIVLDFAGIDTIGPAFADEIFRVFSKEHPQVRLAWIHAAENVEKMIRRALSHATDAPAPPPSTPRD